MLNALLLFADEAPKEAAKTPPAAPGDALFTFLPMILIFVAFYLLVLRPGQRRMEDEKKKMLETLSKGDKILTIGGIYGTVVSVSDKEDEVTVKVDDNTRVKMVKSAVARNITKEEAAKAPKADAPAPAATGITTGK